MSGKYVPRTNDLPTFTQDSNSDSQSWSHPSYCQRTLHHCGPNDDYFHSESLSHSLAAICQCYELSNSIAFGLLAATKRTDWLKPGSSCFWNRELMGIEHRGSDFTAH